MLVGMSLARRGRHSPSYSCAIRPRSPGAGSWVGRRAVEGTGVEPDAGGAQCPGVAHRLGHDVPTQPVPDPLRQEPDMHHLHRTVCLTAEFVVPGRRPFEQQHAQEDRRKAQTRPNRVVGPLPPLVPVPRPAHHRVQPAVERGGAVANRLDARTGRNAVGRAELGGVALLEIGAGHGGGGHRISRSNRRGDRRYRSWRRDSCSPRPGMVTGWPQRLHAAGGQRGGGAA